MDASARPAELARLEPEDRTSRCHGVQREPLEPLEPVPRPISPEAVCRELTEAITRTETLRQRIVANLDDAEREIEAIRQAAGIARSACR